MEGQGSLREGHGSLRESLGASMEGHGPLRKGLGSPSEGLAVAELKIWITFDRAAPWQLGITSGSGWARVAVNAPASACAQESATEKRLVKYVRAALETLSNLLPAAYAVQTVVGGPDAPSDSEAFRLRLHECCVGASDSSTSPTLPRQTFASPVSISLLGRRNPSSGSSSPEQRHSSAAPAAHPQEALIRQMCYTVQQHVTTFGAAPSFRASAAKGRAHNFIRSVAAAPTAADDIVEEVRRRLAQ
jgi:hypothetical protein